MTTTDSTMAETAAEGMSTVYDPQSVEEKIYKFWEDGGFFKADAHSDKPPFSIVIPQGA